MLELLKSNKLRALGESAGEALIQAPDPAIRELCDALGGQENIFSLDACLTRLRVQVHHLGQVNHDKLQRLGAIGVVIVGKEVQAIFGKRSDSLRQDLDRWFGLGEGDHEKQL